MIGCIVLATIGMLVVIAAARSLERYLDTGTPPDQRAPRQPLPSIEVLQPIQTIEGTALATALSRHTPRVRVGELVEDRFDETVQAAATAQQLSFLDRFQVKQARDISAYVMVAPFSRECDAATSARMLNEYPHGRVSLLWRPAFTVDPKAWCVVDTDPFTGERAA